MHAAPLSTVQSMDEPTGWRPPVGRSFWAEGIFCPSVKRNFIGVKIRVPRHRLAFAIDEELVGEEAIGHLALHDPIFVGLPIEAHQSNTATDHGLFIPVSLIGDRR